MLVAAPARPVSDLSPSTLRRRVAPFAPAALHAALPFDEIVSYIRSNLGRRITLEDMAGVARLSVFQLVHAFRRECAITPYGLVLDLRVEHAKLLLTRGKSIADAAYGAGFSDQSHLTRHFRRRTGITPKRYLAGSRGAT
jgi:AraC-like DNA-binding protein